MTNVLDAARYSRNAAGDLIARLRGLEVRYGDDLADLTSGIRMADGGSIRPTRFV